jgi:hypothetical protein
VLSQLFVCFEGVLVRATVLQTLHDDLVEQLHRETIDVLITFIGVALWAFLRKLGLFFIAPLTNNGSAVGRTDHRIKTSEMTNKTG